MISILRRHTWKRCCRQPQLQAAVGSYRPAQQVQLVCMKVMGSQRLFCIVQKVPCRRLLLFPDGRSTQSSGIRTIQQVELDSIHCWRRESSWGYIDVSSCAQYIELLYLHFSRSFPIIFVPIYATLNLFYISLVLLQPTNTNQDGSVPRSQSHDVFGGGRRVLQVRMRRLPKLLRHL